jgi:hypothetical protein
MSREVDFWKFRRSRKFSVLVFTPVESWEKNDTEFLKKYRNYWTEKLIQKNLQYYVCSSVADPDPVGSGPFLPDPEISPPNPDSDPALVVFLKISVSAQYRAYVYLFTP